MALWTAAGAAEPTTSTAPAAPIIVRVPAAPDLLAGVVDPYDGPGERMRFFQAAGVDNELDAREFSAAAGREQSFVRPFDRWEVLLAFDRSRNQLLDWFEADAYRQDLRRRILEAFDADRDGRLVGKEREAANAALAAGRIPGRRTGAGGPATNPAGRASEGGPDAAELDWMRQRMARQREMLQAAYDRDRNGQIDEQERQALMESIRREAEEQVAQQRLRRWDEDSDGRLSEAERARMDAAAAEQQQRAEAWRRQRELERWDADRDGQLDERELAAQRQAEEEMRREGLKWRDEWEMRQFDLNGNGELDADERLLVEAARARSEIYQREQGLGERRQQERWQQMVAEWRMRNFDTDGDGQLSPAEREQLQRFEAQMRQMGQGLRNRFADLNGDGKVSPEEEAAGREEWRKAGWTIFAKAYRYMDLDGDGQISPREREEFGTRTQAAGIRWIEQFTGQFDRNRDGRLDEREREALIEGINRNFEDRIRRFDADRDGRLNPAEAIRMMEDFVRRELGIEPKPEADEPPPPRR